jgi:hypothetical protein
MLEQLFFAHAPESRQKTRRGFIQQLQACALAVSLDCRAASSDGFTRKGDGVHFSAQSAAYAWDER